MRQWYSSMKRWFLAIASVVSLTVGAMMLLSCGGEGGPVGGGSNGGGGGGNSFNQEFLALLPAGQAGATFVGPETCKNCHNEGQDPVYAEWHDTLHAANNVACESCHGPGSVHALSPSESNILTFPNSTSPIVCAQCHGPTYEEWSNSKHSRLITAPVEEAGTNPTTYGRGSRCIQCHSGLFRAEISEKGIDVGTLEDGVFQEISENTLSHVPYTASCVTCHNPHKKTGNLTQNSQEAQLYHLVFNTDTTPIGPGTTAASFVNFNHVCAECHNGRGTSATDAKLNSGTSRPNMHDSNQYNMLMGVGGYEGTGIVVRNTAHATAPGQCTHCHMGNGSHGYTVKYDTSCQPCHTAADAAARVTSVRSDIVNKLYDLLAQMEAWAQSKFGNKELWNYTSLLQEEGITPPDQAQVPIEIKRARHNYYFVIRDSSLSPHNAPYARSLIDIARDQVAAVSGQSQPNANRGANLTNEQKYQIVMQDLELARKADLKAED